MRQVRTMSNHPPNNEPMGATEELTPPDEGSKEISVRAIHRILVALDASTNSRAALKTAVNLAETLHSEVLGLFVEDINLVRLAELPFAREVLFGENTVRHLTREGLQRNLRARAAILRRELEELTAEHKVAGSFRVIRGPVESELLTAALETDLLALGRLGHSIIHRAKLGSTARMVVAQATSAVLLVKSEVAAGPIIALFDGSVAGQHALEMAADLAKQVDDMRVLVWAFDEEGAFERRQFAAKMLEDSEVRMQIQHFSGDSPGRVIQWVNRQKGSLLILGGRESNLPADVFEVLLDEAEQHILVVR